MITSPPPLSLSLYLPDSELEEVVELVVVLHSLMLRSCRRYWPCINDSNLFWSCCCVFFNCTFVEWFFFSLSSSIYTNKPKMLVRKLRMINTIYIVKLIHFLIFFYPKYFLHILPLTFLSVIKKKIMKNAHKLSILIQYINPQISCIYISIINKIFTRTWAIHLFNTNSITIQVQTWPKSDQRFSVRFISWGHH